MAENSISFRGKIRLASYISFAIIALTIFSVTQTVKVKKYEREILLTRQQALICLDEYLSDITADLQKVVYVNSPSMISNLSSKLWRDCAEAKNSLSLLPSNDSSVANTYTFLSQLGEYIMSINRKSCNGEALTESERQKLTELCKYALELSDKIGEMCSGMQNGTLSFEKNSNMFLKADNTPDTVFEKMDDVEQTLSNIPTLVFDGPFSNHIEDIQPKLLEGKDEINKNDALKIANGIFGTENLKFAFEKSGTIPCYVFKDGNRTVAITKKGGYPLYSLNESFAGEISVKYDTAIKNAKIFLDKIGYKNMEESYYFTDDGICTINFAFSQDNIVCYSDLIKVSVNLQNGEIHSFDATGYITCHEEREIPSDILSPTQCREALYSGLEVLDHSLCLMPTEWKSEILCYEFVCAAKGGQHLLIYINAVTGKEENILIMLYSDGGVLTK